MLQFEKFLFGVFLACVVFCQGASTRVMEISTETDEFLEVEIVCDAPCGVVRYASEELQLFLGKALGRTVAVVPQPSDNGLQLILGNGLLTREAGLDVSTLPNEGYYIRRVGNRVYLVGVDDPDVDFHTTQRLKNEDRGTLNAAYDFLERFIGVRFYFPHECGTVVPFLGSLRLPKRIDIMDYPDLTSRMWSFYGWGKGWSKCDEIRLSEQMQLRLRYRAKPYGQSNALEKYYFIERFAKTHPEYFALMPDGKRYCDKKLRHTGQLCFSSGIVEELYQDVKAYLTGQPASSRGMKNWDRNAFSQGFANICPVDALYWCGCEQCSKIASQGHAFYKIPEEKKRVNDFIWKLTAEMANRLKQEGVPGKLIQLSYEPYNLEPPCEIPDNVQVTIAVFPGIISADNPRLAKNEEQIAPWLRCIKGGVILRAWTGKTMQRAIPFIPAFKHNLIGQYFAERRHRYVGAFIDEHSDFFMFTYLNLYLFSKMAWNQDIDPKAVLDEHFSLMFGKAAPLMRRFYDDLERLWNDKVLRSAEDSNLGAIFEIPDEIELWNSIYSPAKIDEYNALFDDGERLTTGAERERVQFIRREILDKLAMGSRIHTSKRFSLADWKVRPGETVFLRPHRGSYNEVQTTVTVEESTEMFAFRFHCEEPFMEEVKAEAVQDGSFKIFDDSDVELFLRPRGDSFHFFQLGVNTNGVMTALDYANEKKRPQSRIWDSGAKCTLEKSADAWAVRLEIPKESLGDYDANGFTVNFGRRRVFKSERQAHEEYYKWCPFAGGTFHDLDNWGKLALNEKPEANLLKNPSLVGTPANGSNFMGWYASLGKGNHEGQKIELDRQYFITQGQSVHLVNTEGNTIWFTQRVTNLKPYTRYSLSFYIRTKDVVARRESLFSGVYVTKNVNVHLPPNYISGTHEWTRMAFEFSTPKAEEINPNPAFGIIMKAPGEAWFDEMILKELKEMP